LSDRKVKKPRISRLFSYGGLEFVVAEPHCRSFALDPFPDRAPLLIGEKNPVGHFACRAAAAFADIVEKRGANADARTIRKIVKIRRHKGDKFAAAPSDTLRGVQKS
jgi:hypothetical protein